MLNDGAPRKKTEGVDLCSCSSVEYQERDSVPGVTYTDKSGTCVWTEVRGRRSRRRTVGNLPSSRPSSASEQSESDSEDFVRPPSSTVKFVAVDGQPGLLPGLGHGHPLRQELDHVLSLYKVTVVVSGL